MNWTETCAVVIPCFNEASALPALLPQVRQHLPRIIVVDDGSFDGTAPAAAQAGATVLRHPHRAGKGAALATGLRYLHQLGQDWALLMDGDGQHDPADIPRFLAAATRTAASLIVGNRMTAAAPMPWLRRTVNRWMSQRLSRFTRCSLPDSQCGFRLLRLSVWATLPLETAHFETESELLIRWVEGGHALSFIPITVIYGNEQTKISPLTDTWRWFRWFGKTVARRTWLGPAQTRRAHSPCHGYASSAPPLLSPGKILHSTIPSAKLQS
ncbi:MAG: glycosyltransferase family 2 protein [Verrucomicrobiota bacterium]